MTINALMEIDFSIEKEDLVFDFKPGLLSNELIEWE